MTKKLSDERKLLNYSLQRLDKILKLISKLNQFALEAEWKVAELYDEINNKLFEIDKCPPLQPN